MITDNEIEQRLRSAFQVVADRTETARDLPRARRDGSSAEPVLLVLDSSAAPGDTSSWRLARVAAAALVAAVVAAALVVINPWKSERVRVVHVPAISGNPTASANPVANVSVNPDIANVGNPAPAISGTDFSGNPLAVANDGRPHVLVVVAHWCPPCQETITRLVRLDAQNALDGITVYGVVSATTPDGENYPPEDWLAHQRWPFPTFNDADNNIAKSLGATALPFYVFVDANGQVVGRLAGDLTDAQLTLVFEALAEGRPLPIAVEGWVPATTVP